MTDAEMDELNRVTREYIEAHPVDWDAYLRYVMSDDWRPCEPFTYERGR